MVGWCAHDKRSAQDCNRAMPAAPQRIENLAPTPQGVGANFAASREKPIPVRRNLQHRAKAGPGRLQSRSIARKTGLGSRQSCLIAQKPAPGSSQSCTIAPKPLPARRNFAASRMSRSGSSQNRCRHKPRITRHDCQITPDAPVCAPAMAISRQPWWRGRASAQACGPGQSSWPVRGAFRHRRGRPSDNRRAGSSARDTVPGSCCNGSRDAA